jgi:hypothetical protein
MPRGGAQAARLFRRRRGGRLALQRGRAGLILAAATAAAAYPVNSRKLRRRPMQQAVGAPCASVAGGGCHGRLCPGNRGAGQRPILELHYAGLVGLVVLLLVCAVALERALPGRGGARGRKATVTARAARAAPARDVSQGRAGRSTRSGQACALEGSRTADEYESYLKATEREMEGWR